MTLDVGSIAVGLGLGLLMSYTFSIRPLTNRIAEMRYVGFMGDPKPDRAVIEKREYVREE